MKAPKGSRLATIAKNLRRGSHQPDKIIFDSRRMKNIPDRIIEQELSRQLRYIAKITKIKFVNRHGAVIDIK